MDASTLPIPRAVVERWGQRFTIRFLASRFLGKSQPGLQRIQESVLHPQKGRIFVRRPMMPELVSTEKGQRYLSLANWRRNAPATTTTPGVEGCTSTYCIVQYLTSRRKEKPGTGVRGRPSR